MFVSTKRLLAGDSVLFIRYTEIEQLKLFVQHLRVYSSNMYYYFLYIRDEKSQLLLGIRRANRQQPALASSVLSSDSMHIGILAAAAHAAANNSPFTIFYNPRYRWHILKVYYELKVLNIIHLPLMKVFVL